MSYALLVAFALLTPAAIVGTWAQRHLVDERGYLQTVAPLSSDPRVQQAVASAVTAQVVAALPIKSITDSLPSALTGIGDAAADAATKAVGNAVTDVTTSPQFASVWLSANQSAHAQLSEVLATAPGTSDVQLKLDLQPVVDAVQQHLVDNGFAFLRGLTIDVNGQTAMVTVPQSDLAPARDAFTVLHALAPWLPLAVLLLQWPPWHSPRNGPGCCSPRRSPSSQLLAPSLLPRPARTPGTSRTPQQSSAAAVAIGDALRHSIGQWLREVSMGALVLAIVAFVCLWFREVQLGRLQSTSPQSA